MSIDNSLQPRRKPVQARARATVDAIVQATAQVLVEEGYDRATTNRIAEVAGVSIGTLYQYFPGKEALVVALVETHVERGMTALREGLDAMRDATLADAVRALIQANLALYAVNPALSRVITQHLPQQVVFEKMRTSGRDAQEMVKAHLALRREELAPTDLDVAAFLVVTTVEAAASKVVVKSPELVGDPHLADELTRMVLGYLLKPPSS